jgi:hypothetical protein
VIGDFMDGADVRMVERRGGPRFAPEPLDHGGVAGHRRQKLQRDLASKRQILGEIDDSHPAAAEQRLDPVMTDRVTAIHVNGRSRATSRDGLYPLGFGSCGSQRARQIAEEHDSVVEGDRDGAIALFRQTTSHRFSASIMRARDAQSAAGSSRATRLALWQVSTCDDLASHAPSLRESEDRDEPQRLLEQLAPPFGMWSLLNWPSYANCVIAGFVELARKMSAPRVSI